MKKKDLLLYIVLLTFPFVDFLSSIATWEGWPSIGVLYKGIFILGCLGYLLKNKLLSWKVVGVLFGYGILVSIFYIQADYSLGTELSNLIKIFFLPTLILFFSKYKNSYINKKTVMILSVMYLLLYLLPYPFHLGHNMNELYPNKNMYLSYFYIGNELANVFILLVPIALLYFIDEKKYGWLCFYSVLVILMAYLLGTKTMYLSILLVFLYFLWHYRLELIPKIKKHCKVIGVSFLFIVTLLFFIIPKTDFYQNIKTTLEYYEINSWEDVFTVQSIDNLIYSNRLDFWVSVHERYEEESLAVKVFGLGRGTILQIKDIEIDILDIFYSIGILGTIIYLWYFWYVYNMQKIRGIYKFLFGLFGVISLFAGHVLLSPMVSTYVALLFGLNYNERSEGCETLDKKSN